MSRDPAYAETEPQYMMLDAEREAEEALASRDYHLPLPLPEPLAAMMRTLSAVRAAERLATEAESIRHYSTTARGRLAAERVDAAARAQLDATKETR